MRDYSKQRPSLNEIDRNEQAKPIQPSPQFSVLDRAQQKYISTNEAFFDRLVAEVETFFDRERR